MSDLIECQHESWQQVHVGMAGVVGRAPEVIVFFCTKCLSVTVRQYPTRTAMFRSLGWEEAEVA